MTDVTRILSQIESGDPSAAEQLLPLVYEELAKFAEEEPEKAKLVKLRYFAGLTIVEAAVVLGISRAMLDCLKSVRNNGILCRGVYPIPDCFKECEDDYCNVIKRLGFQFTS